MKTLILTVLMMVTLILIALAIIAYFNQSDDTNQKQSSALSGDFKDYWFSGKAEISIYNLSRGRYRENHKGEAVKIYVTEPFLPLSQVKFEGLPISEKPINILKMISTQRFYTGIYPYSVMTSVFTPVKTQDGKTLKVTMSSQDWCGQVFSQLNRKDGFYELRNFSYFQNEGDRIYRLDEILLEDELWTLLRLDPMNLPKGHFKIFPGSAATRLSHREMKAEEATGGIIQTGNGGFAEESVSIYRLEYKNIKRILNIKFQSRSPYKILGWEEIFEEFNGKLLTTKATLSESINLDYWNKNSVADSLYRRMLGLD